MEETKQIEEKKVEPKTTPITEGNIGTLTVKLLDQLNKMVGLTYDTNVEIHKQLLSIDNRLRNIMEQANKKEDIEE